MAEPEIHPIPLFHADNADIISFAFGCRILFATRLDKDVMKPIASVHFSPQLMKAIMILLQKHIETYEERIGEIKLHQGFYNSLKQSDIDNLMEGPL